MNCYHKVIKINPNFADAHYNLGVLLQSLGNNHDAKSFYERALKLDSTNKEYASGYGKLLLKLNEHAKGLKFITEGQGAIVFNQSNLEII